MNSKAVKHLLVMVLGVSILMAFMELVKPLTPILKAGSFPDAHQWVSALASALGVMLDSFVAVAAVYAAKMRVLGGSQDPTPTPAEPKFVDINKAMLALVNDQTPSPAPVATSIKDEVQK